VSRTKVPVLVFNHTEVAIGKGFGSPFWRDTCAVEHGALGVLEAPPHQARSRGRRRIRPSGWPAPSQAWRRPSPSAMWKEDRKAILQRGDPASWFCLFLFCLPGFCFAVGSAPPVTGTCTHSPQLVFAFFGRCIIYSPYVTIKRATAGWPLRPGADCRIESDNPASFMLLIFLLLWA